MGCKTLPIGAYVEIGGTAIEVQESEYGCAGCYFCVDNGCTKARDFSPCTISGRDDHKVVKFIEVPLRNKQLDFMGELFYGV